MKIIICIVIFSVSLFARNDILYFPLDFLQESKAKNVLDSSIELSFGSGSKEEIITKRVRSNKKTNTIGKSDKEACEWVLLSALKSLQARARIEGGTKVVNIIGFYYKNHFDSNSEFQCGASNIMASVTLYGDIAK